jgi:hypothetical protein
METASLAGQDECSYCMDFLVKKPVKRVQISCADAFHKQGDNVIIDGALT